MRIPCMVTHWLMRVSVSVRVPVCQSLAKLARKHSRLRSALKEAADELAEEFNVEVSRTSQHVCMHPRVCPHLHGTHAQHV